MKIINSIVVIVLNRILSFRLHIIIGYVYQNREIRLRAVHLVMVNSYILAVCPTGVVPVRDCQRRLRRERNHQHAQQKPRKGCMVAVFFFFFFDGLMVDSLLVRGKEPSTI